MLQPAKFVRAYVGGTTTATSTPNITKTGLRCLITLSLLSNETHTTTPTGNE